MKILTFFSLALMIASITAFIQGEWKIGLAILAVDIVLSCIGGHLLMKRD